MPKSNSENSKKLNRRQALLLPATAGIGAALASPANASDSIKTAVHQASGGCSTPRSAVAKTQYGKVRGFVDAGVLTFKGIPYGQDTSGDNRWLPAKPPKPSAGPREKNGNSLGQFRPDRQSQSARPDLGTE